MALSNTSERFGSLTKLLHWAIFVLFCTQFTLIYTKRTFPENSPESTQFMLLHISFGVLVLVLALFMIFWRNVGTRPIMPMNMSNLEIFFAKLVHFLLYLSMLVMPITGYLMSTLAGYDVAFFGWNLPNFFAKNEGLAEIFFKTHVFSSYVIIGLVSLHVIASLYHHFIRKDNVLRRMLPM